MKILTALTYYRPHTSGLTIYAERLAKAFARRGHQVTVMTMQYEPSLPREESMDGMKIVRVPVMARVSKGVIAPTIGWVATKLVKSHDVVQLHLPQFDAPGIAGRARLLGKPAVLTYHCDLLLPPGTFNRMVNAVVDFQNNLAGRLANHIVTYTQVCTEEFRMYFVAVVDSLGNPVDSLQTIVSNDRGKQYDFSSYLPPPFQPGAYYAMTDGYQNDFSTTPGRILFSGKKENKEVAGEFYFNTDKCRCHAYKVSGPDTLVFK